MAPKIVVVGSANTDFVLTVPALPSHGETVLGEQFRVVQGGKGANQAVAAARLGADVTLVARLGTDSFGDESLAAYRQEGIHTDFVVQDPDIHSGVALIMVNAQGENLIGVGPGANSHLSVENVQSATTAIQEADCLLLQLEVPLGVVQAAVEIARRNGIKVILNPAPARKIPQEILEGVDFLTPNETEAAILAGKNASDLGSDSLPALASILGVPHLVVTLGSRGACILQNGQSTMVSPFSVKPVDTTASGDAFNGALAVALARGQSLPQAVRYANAAGAITATRPGAQPSLPTREELDQFMVSSAPGSNPAVPDAVDSFDQAGTPS
ncbi:MAG TPA: ribokinase [Anaerolineales bacterium]|jgi:ribokinase|nr:ribokinase [Anaerolineales bacterium]